MAPIILPVALGCGTPITYTTLTWVNSCKRYFMVDKVGVEPTSRGGLISRTPQCYLPIKPLVLGTPRGRYSSRAPDTDIQYGCLRSMPLANDDIRFISDCSTPAFHRWRLIIASPRVFHLKSGRIHTRFQSRLGDGRGIRTLDILIDSQALHRWTIPPNKRLGSVAF